MSKMFIISEEELSGIVREKRLAALAWVREAISLNPEASLDQVFDAAHEWVLREDTYYKYAQITALTSTPPAEESLAVEEEPTVTPPVESNYETETVPEEAIVPEALVYDLNDDYDETDFVKATPFVQQFDPEESVVEFEQVPSTDLEPYVEPVPENLEHSLDPTPIDGPSQATLHSEEDAVEIPDEIPEIIPEVIPEIIPEPAKPVPAFPQQKINIKSILREATEIDKNIK